VSIAVDGADLGLRVAELLAAAVGLGDLPSAGAR
jgi:hypothetical protein